MSLSKEDYEEQSCLLDTSKLSGNPSHTVPVARIVEKEDEFLSKNDYGGAERLLKYWLSEAEQSADEKGCFAMRNELMGLYRKLSRKKEALECAEKALELTDSLGYENTVSGATCLINCATVYKAFGRSEDAAGLFEKARSVYESRLEKNDARLGGLYNNMALALTDLGRFDEAESLYYKAIAVMDRTENGQPEKAVSWLNLASCIEARKGLAVGEEEIGDCITRAWEILSDETLERNGNYAFVCEKCAQVFGYYGYFMYQQELQEAAEKIYARS